MMLRITFALFASYLLLLVISTAEAIVCSGHDELLVAMEIEREDMIIEQLARAEQCSGSPYARACRQDSVMLFAQTMLGSCTPVGCFDLGNTTPKAMVLKGDYEAAVTVAVVQQQAARLAEHAPGQALLHHFQKTAIEFELDESRTNSIVHVLLEHSNGELDLPALRFFVELAHHKGYVGNGFGDGRKALARHSRARFLRDLPGKLVGTIKAAISAKIEAHQRAAKVGQQRATIVDLQAVLQKKRRHKDDPDFTLVSREHLLVATRRGLSLHLDLERSERKVMQDQLSATLKHQRSLTDHVESLRAEVTSQRRQTEIEIAVATERELTSRGQVTDLTRKLDAEVEAKAGVEESLSAATAEIALLRQSITTAEEQVRRFIQKEKEEREKEKEKNKEKEREKEKTEMKGKEKQQKRETKEREKEKKDKMEREMDKEREKKDEKMDKDREKNDQKEEKYITLIVAGLLTFGFAAALLASVLRRENDALADELESTRAKLRESTADKDALADELESTRAKLRESTADKDALADELESTRAKLRESTADKDALADELESTRAKLRESTADKEIALRDLARLTEAKKDAKDSAARQLAQAREAALRGRQELEQREKLQAADKRTLRIELNRTKAALGEVREKCSTVTQTVEMQRKQLDAIAVKLRRAEEEKEGLNVQVNDAVKSKVSVQDDLQRVQKELEATTRKLRRTEDAVSAGACVAIANASANASGTVAKQGGARPEQSFHQLGPRYPQQQQQQQQQQQKHQNGHQHQHQHQPCSPPPQSELHPNDASPTVQARVRTPASTTTLQQKTTRVLSGSEQLRQSTKPVISGLRPWSGRSMKLLVDGDGNCYGVSWLLVVILSAVQDQQRIENLLALLRSSLGSGVMMGVPEEFKPYVSALLHYVEELTEAWRVRPAGSSNAKFGVELAANVVQAFMVGVNARYEVGREPTWFQLKMGTSLFSRAIDVAFATKHSFSGNLDELYTLCTSVMFDVGTEEAIAQSLQCPDGKGAAPVNGSSYMRPGAGMGCVVGLEVEFMTSSAANSGEPVKNTMDYTDTFRKASPDQVFAAGFRVVKVAANHYEVRVEGGPLAELLAGRFGINLDNGDAEAMETMQRDAQGQIDDRNPNLGAVLSPEELKGAMKLAQEYEERQRQEQELARKPTVQGETGRTNHQPRGRGTVGGGGGGGTSSHVPRRGSKGANRRTGR